MVRVLVVDDSALARRIATDALTRGGFRIVGQAASGQEAIGLCRTLHPDVVTLDMRMPGIDGLETLHRILQLDPKTRVVMVSLVGQEEQILTAIRAGARGYVVKPYEPATLLKAIEKATGERAEAGARDADALRQRRLFLSESQQILEKLDQAIDQLSRESDKTATVVSIGRHYHSLRGMAAQMGCDPMATLAEQLESLLAEVRDKKIPVTHELSILLTDSLPVFQKLLEGFLRGEDFGIYAQAFGWRLTSWLAASESSAGLAGGTKVLIVDDDGFTRKILEGFFLRAGCRVLLARDGAEGLQRVQTDCPDLIIVDQVLPRVSGLDLIRAVRENPYTAPIPIIMVTIKAELEDKLKGFAAGADDYVPKPFDPEEVVARAKALLKRLRPR